MEECWRSINKILKLNGGKKERYSYDADTVFAKKNEADTEFW
jgi:hypothetical protein